MALLTKDDLNINGFGSSAGGSFRNVTLNGSAKVNGDLDCMEFESNGHGSVNGNLTAQKIRLNGLGKLNGTVRSTGSVQMDGKGYIEKDAFIKKMTINGLATIGGHVKGHELILNGKTTINGDCEVEAFKAEGAFKIKGLLNADQISIKAHGFCQADEIGGQEIRVRFQKGRFFKLFKPFLSIKLEANSIEGNIIELENTHAKVVRGENIIIGADCEIDLVEYSGTLKNTKGSKIKESKKI